MDYRKQTKIFLIFLSLVWIGRGLYEIIKVSFSNGIKILVFGGVFLTALYFIQKYFIKILALYNKNLNKYVKK